MCNFFSAKGSLLDVIRVYNGNSSQVKDQKTLALIYLGYIYALQKNCEIKDFVPVKYTSSKTVEWDEYFGQLYSGTRERTYVETEIENVPTQHFKAHQALEEKYGYVNGSDYFDQIMNGITCDSDKAVYLDQLMLNLYQTRLKN